MRTRTTKSGMRGAMKLTSSTFDDGATIPEKCAYSACGGTNLSPDLQWSDAPSGTQSYALLCHDPDAPTGTGFYHWVLFNIPAETTRLPAGAGGTASGGLPRGAVAGFTDYGEVGYGGPCPPPGPAHHYNFTLYALGKKLEGLNEFTTGAKLRFMMRDCTLAEARLTGLFHWLSRTRTAARLAPAASQRTRRVRRCRSGSSPARLRDAVRRPTATRRTS